MSSATQVAYRNTQHNFSAFKISCYSPIYSWQLVHVVIYNIQFNSHESHQLFSTFKEEFLGVKFNYM
jgi:hypothetical protein